MDSQWQKIIAVKHPVMAGREILVRTAIERPDQFRRSRSAHDVYLCYNLDRPGRWVCAVVKQTGREGFLITAYLTDAIKEGVLQWPK
jgi:hypothetical protein